MTLVHFKDALIDRKVKLLSYLSTSFASLYGEKGRETKKGRATSPSPDDFRRLLFDRRMESLISFVHSSLPLFFLLSLFLVLLNLSCRWLICFYDCDFQEIERRMSGMSSDDDQPPTQPFFPSRVPMDWGLLAHAPHSGWTCALEGCFPSLCQWD